VLSISQGGLVQFLLPPFSNGSVGYSVGLLTGDGTGRILTTSSVQLAIANLAAVSNVTVLSNSSLALPSMTTLSSASVTVYGTLVGASNIVIGTGSVLTLQPNSSSSGLPLGWYSFSSIDVTGNGNLVVLSGLGLLVSGTLTVEGNGVMNVSAGVGGMSVSVTALSMTGSGLLLFSGSLGITAVTSVSIGVGAVINGTGGGYKSSAGACVIGNPGSGGSHGGYGSVGSSGGSAMVPCSGFQWPTLMGSGGVGWSSPGGPGGGALSIIVNATATSVLDLNGTIAVDGMPGSPDPLSPGGGGSGGSIAIDAIMCSGSGTLSAHGGMGGM